MLRRLREDGRFRRWAVAALLYVVTTGVYFAFAAPQRLTQHTPYNHFALLAEAWLAGRLDLGGPPPAYAMGNDFALFQGKWYVTFPPFPALLLLPVVALACSATRVQDGQFFLWLAGVAPAIVFLALEKLRRTRRTQRTTAENLMLAALFGFGTVYFFTALQGTVWFAAHVVGAGLAALYLAAALDADHPWVAGLALGLGFLTRTPLLFAAPLFLLEAWRCCLRPLPLGPGLSARVDLVRFGLKVAAFGVPVAVALGLAAWHNHARFGSPGEFGYRFLTVGWQARIEKWGLFDYHYLARNLGALFTSLPWLPASPVPGAAPFQINAHGLALWVTTPAFLWLVWPKRTGGLHRTLWLTVLGVALPSLLYQNTGWVQFGQRFTNDYAPFLIALLAVGGRRFGGWFALAAVLSVAVNTFGALSFDRARFARYYFQEPTQSVFYQPD